MPKLVAVSTEPLKTVEQLLEYENLLLGHADLMHCDVMDGVFVEQKLLPFDMLSEYAQQAKMPFDIHLMTVDLQDEYQKYLNLKPKFLTVHYETFKSQERLKDVLMLIGSTGVGAGLCINPQTQIDQIEHLLPYCDLLLIMSVVAGYGGQAFLPQTIQKIKQAKHIITQKNLSVLIQVDGGITPQISSQLFELGANIVVSGSFVFKAQDRAVAIAQLKQ
jgi:ribulose-phosphate 3-epimerase